jgi:hypothetical protein
MRAGLEQSGDSGGDLLLHDSGGFGNVYILLREVTDYFRHVGLSLHCDTHQNPA